MIRKMLGLATLMAPALLPGLVLALGHRRAAPEPEQFIIARSSFWDFGPPMNSYDLFIVRSTPTGASVERISLTPPGAGCNDLPELRTASKMMGQSVESLLGPVNPCAIHERELAKEMRRGKKGLVFSGADIVMQVQCGSRTRLIRADILDRDMFDAHPDTPHYTSWTMRLLGVIGKGLGPGPMDRPIFSIPGKISQQVPVKEWPVLRDVGAGRYDALFGSDKLSDLYRRAIQPPPPPPKVVLVSCVPYAPVVFVRPNYPPIAVLARVQGAVHVRVAVDRNGSPGAIAFESGVALLRPAVKQAVGGWKFPRGEPNREVEATISFTLHCTNPVP